MQANQKSKIIISLFLTFFNYTVVVILFLGEINAIICSLIQVSIVCSSHVFFGDSIVFSPIFVFCWIFVVVYSIFVVVYSIFVAVYSIGVVVCSVCDAFCSIFDVVCLTFDDVWSIFVVFCSIFFAV